MTENIETPLNVEIINIGTKTNAFVPYGENARFPLEPNGKISFEVKNSEIGLYYKKQATEDLFVGVNNGVTTTKTGTYDLYSNAFSANASFISSLVETSESTDDGVKTTTQKYEVFGTLPYSEATPSIGMPAGNRFTVQFSYPGITELPSGKIANVSIEGGTSNDYTKSAFETDLSLVSIVNVTSNSKLTVTVKWKENYVAVYEFTFKDVKLGQVNEVIADLQNISIVLPQEVKITNVGKETIKLVPFKQNFDSKLNQEESMLITAGIAEEAMYYLLQSNDSIKVELIETGE